MTLQSAIEAELPFLRAEAEARMKACSRATVKRQNGTTTDADGYEVPAWEVVYTDIPCRISAGSTSDGGSRGVSIGGVTFEDATGVGHFPHPSPLFRDGDIFELTAGDWVGDFFMVVAAIRYDQQTARRLPIKEAAEPDGWSA